MVPPELMLTKKISGRAKQILFCCVAGIGFLTACGPPGPRALLSGEHLVEQAKYEKAIPKLLRATQLLPTNAPAWNYLGLAYHGNHQPLLAIKAYRQALTIDSSLAAARFNLGCAYLDNGEVGPAIDQLTSFTYVNPHSVDGWVKLGSAHLRTNHVDLAERSFRVALDLQTNNVEALNGLGMVQFQRRRYADAFNTFNFVSTQNPKYAPALLNAAIAAHQIPASRQTALQFYRRYLALKPSEAERITVVANQLDAELNPPPRPPVQVASAAPPKTNTVVSTNQIAATIAGVTSAPPRTTQVAVAPPKPATVSPAPTSNVFALSNLTASDTVPKPGIPEPPVEVTKLDTPFVVVPPQEIATSIPRSAPTVTAPPAVATSAPSTVVVSAPLTTNAQTALPIRVPAKPQKKGFWDRLNPFSGKAKTSNQVIEIASTVPSTPNVVVLNTNPVVEAPPPTPPPPEPPVVIQRYEYKFPPKGAAGNRVEAQKYLREGVTAQKAGLQSEAIAKYKKAAELDPSFFDARLNLALAAYTAGNWDETLSASEQALAIRPESVEARYWFGSALREAKYPQDAADQWLIILQDHPDDARVHLSLAKLYAGQLRQPQLAREHYIKVLELAPNHPDAVRIRFWLAGNPPK
jgi:tetratricopeptide (TPR) repeat protein